VSMVNLGPLPRQRRYTRLLPEMVAGTRASAEKISSSNEDAAEPARTV
jgi:hypothetical protein